MQETKQAPQTLEEQNSPARHQWCPQEQAVLGACQCGRPATHVIRWEIDARGLTRPADAAPRLACRKCWLAEMEGPVFDAWLREEEQLAFPSALGR